MSEVKKEKSRGATSWPRLNPRPESMSWGEYLFEVLIIFTRPIWTVAAVVLLIFPTWKSVVSYLMNDLGMSERLFFAVLTVGTHHTVWAVMNSFFVTIDHFGWLERFRLPTTPATRPSPELVKQALWESLIGGGPMFLGCFVFFPVYKYFGMMHPLDPVPSFWELVKFYSLVKFGSSFLFDLSHRIIHDAKYYKSIHAKHHRFVATQSMAAEFAHPIEGAGPILVPLVLGFHPVAWFVFLCWEQYNSAICHSGYCFYIFEGKWSRVVGLNFLAEDALYHHHHHYRQAGNFSNPVFDHLYGTMDEWLYLGGARGYWQYLHDKEKDRRARAQQAAPSPPPPTNKAKAA